MHVLSALRNSAPYETTEPRQFWLLVFPCVAICDLSQSEIESQWILNRIIWIQTEYPIVVVVIQSRFK